MQKTKEAIKPAPYLEVLQHPHIPSPKKALLYEPRNCRTASVPPASPVGYRRMLAGVEAIR